MNIDYSKCPMYNKISGEWKEAMGEEGCIYPYYGVAPHKHNFFKTGTFIGSTEIIPKSLWPDNFKEDPECEGCGVYECPYDKVCENK